MQEGDVVHRGRVLGVVGEHEEGVPSAFGELVAAYESELRSA